MKYIMDSNSFITPKNLYYPFDIFPSYWNVLSKLTRDAGIIINTQINEELMNGDDNDRVKVWIEEEFHGEIINTYEENIVNEWQKILNFIQTSDLYNQRAFDAWADEKVADPWIIATAKIHNCTVVSLEDRNVNLSSGSPTHKIKIPDVCDFFNVPCINLQDMLRRLQVVL